MIKTFEYSYNDDHEDLSGVVMVVMIKRKQTITITLEKIDNDLTVTPRLLGQRTVLETGIVAAKGNIWSQTCFR